MDTSSFSFSSPREALDALLGQLRPVSTETCPLSHAGGRVLARALEADRPSPAIDVSVMDGFALARAEIRDGSIPIHGEAVIGSAPITLNPGTAARIVTGAPVPQGADCVIRIEDVRIEGERLVLEAGAFDRVPPNQNIRRRGENAQTGERVLEAGTTLSAAAASGLASLGVHRPTVYRRLRVAVLSTGDEVLGAHETPEPWQLRDGNGPALERTIGSLGFVESVEYRRVRDDEKQLRASASELLSRSDALFLSGGVSMGHRDFVPQTLRSLGARTVFHKVPQRPGKPILAAVGPRDQLIMGLPGNPVSVLVTAHRFGVPALARVAGVSSALPQPRVEIARPDTQTIALWWHRLVRLNAEGKAELVDHRGSGDVIAAARSDGFVEIAPGAAASGSWPYFAWR